MERSLMDVRRGCLAFLLTLFLSCTAEEVPGGEVTIRNDILDKEYNSFVVDQVTTVRGNTGFRATLKPGDQVTLPQKSITSMRFTRRYKDFSRVYVIECPSDLNKRLTIKLIDVHLNRLRGGCELIKRGENRDGFMKWEK